MIFEKQHKQKVIEDDPKGANKLDGTLPCEWVAFCTGEVRSGALSCGIDSLNASVCLQRAMRFGFSRR
jgi:hypothetical protein